MITSTDAPSAQPTFRFHPEAIAEAVNEGRTPARIEEMLRDSTMREELANELMQKVSSLNERFASVEDLNTELEMVSDTYARKKTFFDRMKGTAKWAYEKVKGFVTHPVVKTVVIAALLVWGLSELYGFLQAGNLELAAEAEEAMRNIGAAGESLSPTSGITAEGAANVGGPMGTAPPTSAPYDAQPFSQ